jgi:hypothetical protein
MPTILDRKGAQALVYFLFFGTVTKGLLFSIFTKANATTDWELREERTREEGELYGFFFTT